MHPRLAELVAYLDEQRAALLAAVDAVPPERRDVRPTADEWSVAEVLDHLQIVEHGTTRLLTRRFARAREAGIPPESRHDSVLGALDHTGLLDAPPRVAPEMVRPRADARAADALAALADARAELRRLLESAAGLDLTRVTASHAFLGEIDAYQWVLFLAHHERRHVGQIARQAAAPSPPAPSAPDDPAGRPAG
jgi:uncharacterized damage-inducible protein DinB